MFEWCQRLGAVTPSGSRRCRAGRPTRMRTHARARGSALLAMASCYHTLAHDSRARWGPASLAALPAVASA